MTMTTNTWHQAIVMSIMWLDQSPKHLILYLVYPYKRVTPNPNLFWIFNLDVEFDNKVMEIFTYIHTIAYFKTLKCKLSCELALCQLNMKLLIPN